MERATDLATFCSVAELDWDSMFRRLHRPAFAARVGAVMRRQGRPSSGPQAKESGSHEFRSDYFDSNEILGDESPAASWTLIGRAKVPPCLAFTARQIAECDVFVDSNVRGHSQHALSDDIAQNLVGTAGNSHGRRAH